MIYSIILEDQICMGMTEPFEENLTLGPYPAGKYQILMNGIEINTFSID